MRIGVAGAGRIGSFHASTVVAEEAVQEVLVTDAHPEAAERLAAERGYRAVANLEDLLAEVDGLVITASTASHAAILRAAVAAGVPTFCEKPVAFTVEETCEIVSLVEAAGVPVQVGFQRRRSTCRAAAGSSATAASTTSTSSGSSPAARWAR